MSVQHWTILAILSTTLAFTIAARKEFSSSEVCEYIERCYRLTQRMMSGCDMYFNKEDPNLWGKRRILPTPNLIITDCKSKRMMQDSSSMVLDATIKDDYMMLMSEDRPWIEIVNPVVHISLKSEDLHRVKKITVYSVNVQFSKALVNMTSLDHASTESVRKTLSSTMTKYAASRPFKIDHNFELKKGLVGEAIREMLKYYLYRITN